MKKPKKADNGIIRNLLGIDPGPDQSAYVLWDVYMQTVIEHNQLGNVEFRDALINLRDNKWADLCVVEDMTFYGKILNRESFETLKLIGRIQEIYHDNCELVVFPDIAYHFCASRKGVKTANINAVLTDRFGKKGTQKNQGVLYGIKEHEWSALSVAIYYQDEKLKRMVDR